MPNLKNDIQQNSKGISFFLKVIIVAWLYILMSACSSSGDSNSEVGSTESKQEQQETAPCNLFYPAWDSDPTICNSTSAEVDYKRKIVYFKMFLEAYGKLEFGDSSFIIPNSTSIGAEQVLYMIMKLKQGNSSVYNNEYIPFECCWINEYEPCKLYIPQILGQLIKLSEELRLNFSPNSSESELVVAKNYFKNIPPPIKLPNKTHDKDERRAILRDTIINPNEYIKKIDDLIGRTVSKPGEKPSDIDDRVEFYKAELLLTKYFGLDKIKEANNFYKMKQNWDATVMIISKFDTYESGEIEGVYFSNEFIAIKGTKIKNKRYNFNKKSCALCKNELFLGQPAFESLGTGVITNNSFMYTAAHVFVEANPDNVLKDDFVNYLIVKGIELNRNNNKDTVYIVHKKNIYKVDGKISKLDDIKYEYSTNPTGPDWMILPIAMAFDGVNYEFVSNVGLKIIEEAENSVGTSLYGIGHPLGLPKKLAFDGVIVNNNFGNCYSCSLDVFSGNSGCPIFDALDHTMIGILIGGAGYKSEEFEQKKDSICININVDTISNIYPGHFVQRLKFDFQTI